MNFGSALHSALTHGIVALLLFGPLSGITLAGYGYTVQWQRPLLMAVIVALGKFIFELIRDYPPVSRRFQRLGSRHSSATVVGNRGVVHYLGFALIAVVAVILPFVLNSYTLNIAILALIYVLLGLGLNIVVGLAGLLDLGFVAFYAVGAYTYALGAQYWGIGFWQALPLGALLAASFGILLGFPVLRMHGDYLAIVTMGFGEIIRLILNNWLAFTGGPNGVRAPPPTCFGLEFTRNPAPDVTAFHTFFGLDYSRAHRYIFVYGVLLVVVGMLIHIVARLKRMPLGRAWEALREDEIACRSLGINHVTVKLSAFAMGAMVGGVGGVFFAAAQGFVNPSSFTFFESALILAIVVLGGMGSTLGVVTAAILLTVLPELLRDLSDYRLLGFGLVMVAMMIWRPRGLLRLRRPSFTIPESR